MRLGTDRQGCPCCLFDANLFLPPSLIGGDSDDGAIDLHPQSEDDDQPCTPAQALQAIENHVKKIELSEQHNNPVFLLVDTHGHAQLDRPRNEIYAVMNVDASSQSHSEENLSTSVGLKSLTCAVEPADWNATLEFASGSPEILPALGVHPWYLADLGEGWLEELEALLIKHPGAIVGEIGLCKMARFVRQHPEGKAVALGIQRSVFHQQMLLAARLRRPVSVHCVNQQGIFLEVLEEILSSSPNEDLLQKFPAAIAMHSFTGTAHQVNEILKFEGKLSPPRPLFYFGFSHTVNHVMCTSEKARQKGRDAVKAIPNNRLLAESDVHSPADLRGGTAGAIAYIAWARGDSIVDVARTTSENGRAFLESFAIKE